MRVPSVSIRVGQCSVSLGDSVVLIEVDKDTHLGDINCPVSRG